MPEQQHIVDIKLFVNICAVYTVLILTLQTGLLNPCILTITAERSPYIECDQTFAIRIISCEYGGYCVYFEMYIVYIYIYTLICNVCSILTLGQYPIPASFK